MTYAFDNNDPAAADRHDILPAILDDLSISRLADLGDLTGRRCLELGAGGGSIAGWLATQAGPSGRVLATDVNVRHLRTDAGYQVLSHDLLREPVPSGPWDVIHARLVLLHLPTRAQILRDLAAELAPGGALVIEDFEATFRKTVFAAPTPEDVDLVETYHRVLVEQVLPAHDNDSAWAGRVHAAMMDAGLTAVDTVVSARSWSGGSPGARLIAANIAQARSDFLAAGMTVEQLDALERLTLDPGLVVRTPLMYSTTGHRPRSSSILRTLR
jgi:SAM-dependent methyltransferase